MFDSAKLPTPATSSPILDADHFSEGLRWAWRVLWRGKYLMLACWLLVVVPTILILQQTPARYTGTAALAIEGPEASDPLNERLDPRVRLTEYQILTEVEIVTSSMLASRVIDKLRLAQDPEFNPALRKEQPLAAVLSWLNPSRWLAAVAPKTPTDQTPLSPQAREDVERAKVLKAFKARLSARMQRRSYIVFVEFTSESREKAALIANTVAELYVLDRLEASFEDARQLSQWLGTRLESLRTDVNVAESAVEAYRAAHGLRRRSQQEGTVNDQQLSQLNSRLVIARAELAQKQANLDQVRTLVRSRGGVETAANVLQSPLIQHLREQESSVQRQMSEASKTYGDRHPRIIAYRAELGELRGKIASEIEKIGTSIANEVEVAVAGVRTLEREVEAIRLRVDIASEAEVRLRELERQAEASRELYEAFLGRFKRTSEQNDIQRANARIITQATIPSSPSYPRSSFVLLSASILALLAGMGLIFVLDRLDNAVRSSDEAEEVTGLPTVAIVPLVRRTEQVAEQIIDRPRSVLADAIRSLRISLDLELGDADPGQARVLVVTSSVPKEGKTFVGLCLAMMYAGAGQRVLLIDGDVHRPRLHTMIGVANERGLVQVLSGAAEVEEVTLAAVHPGLDFLPAGHLAHVADLLSETRVGALLTKLRPRYDRIIIDSAPVLAVADSRVLGRQADRLIYLVRWSATARDAVRNGLKLLREARVPLHGVVLSQVNQRKHARYAYRDYGQYYGRYRDYYAE